MIERNLVDYLKAEPTLTVLCPRIYAIQPPKDAVMPYIIVENTGGNRKKQGSAWTEEKALFRITVDAGAAQMVAGRDIIEKCLNLLENYRGRMGTATVYANDIYVTCSSIRGWAGMGGAYRFMFDGEARFLEARVTNP